MVWLMAIILVITNRVIYSIILSKDDLSDSDVNSMSTAQLAIYGICCGIAGIALIILWVFVVRQRIQVNLICKLKIIEIECQKFIFAYDWARKGHFGETNPFFSLVRENSYSRKLLWILPNCLLLQLLFSRAAGSLHSKCLTKKWTMFGYAA